MSYGISIDAGTSGTRMHAVDRSDNKIVSTSITVRHPVPGANVIACMRCERICPEKTFKFKELHKGLVNAG